MTSISLILTVYSKCVNMNLVHGLALHKFFVAHRIERPPGNWQVMGSNPVEDSPFILSSSPFFVARFFVPLVDCLLFVCGQFADRWPIDFCESNCSFLPGLILYH